MNSHACEIHAETGRCNHAGRSGLRLHLADTDDASRRADDVVADYCALLADLGALGYRVNGYRMFCDECGTTLPGQYSTFGEARAAAHGLGWVTVSADDLCPECE